MRSLSRPRAILPAGAGDTAARQPRRSAELAAFCKHLAKAAGLLDMALGLLLICRAFATAVYIAVTVNRGEVAQLVRARES